eukprot:GFYU01003064.1.p1 GENE.GFYU01003064.1~~GFYU01003064.1.p1  ORF type:complete len:1232 (-),score=393.53 GFYU01003064.1:193-3483(-)
MHLTMFDDDGITSDFMGRVSLILKKYAQGGKPFGMWFPLHPDKKGPAMDGPTVVVAKEKAKEIIAEKKAEDKKAAEKNAAAVSDKTPTDKDKTPTDKDKTPTDKNKIPTDKDKTPTDKDKATTDAGNAATDKDKTAKPIDGEHDNAAAVPPVTQGAVLLYMWYKPGKLEADRKDVEAWGRSHKETMTVDQLYVKIIEASGLMNADTSKGQTDGFAQVTVAKKVHKTQVIDDNLNPRWNREFVFSQVSEGQSLKVEVFDKNAIQSNKSVGLVELKNLSDIKRAAKPIGKWYPLQGDGALGYLLMYLHFKSKDIRIDPSEIDRWDKSLPKDKLGTDRLFVKVSRAAALKNMDAQVAGDYTDAYAKLYVDPKNVLTTDVVKDELNPKFEKDFQFADVNEAKMVTLEIFDKGENDQDALLGKVEVPLAEYKAGLKPHGKWFPVITEAGDAGGDIMLMLKYQPGGEKTKQKPSDDKAEMEELRKRLKIDANDFNDWCSRVDSVHTTKNITIKVSRAILDKSPFKPDQVNPQLDMWLSLNGVDKSIPSTHFHASKKKNDRHKFDYEDSVVFESLKETGSMPDIHTDAFFTRVTEAGPKVYKLCNALLSGKDIEQCNGKGAMWVELWTSRGEGAKKKSIWVGFALFYVHVRSPNTDARTALTRWAANLPENPTKHSQLYIQIAKPAGLGLRKKVKSANRLYYTIAMDEKVVLAKPENVTVKAGNWSKPVCSTVSAQSKAAIHFFLEPRDGKGEDKLVCYLKVPVKDLSIKPLSKWVSLTIPDSEDPLDKMDQQDYESVKFLAYVLLKPPRIEVEEVEEDVAEDKDEVSDEINAYLKYLYDKAKQHEEDKRKAQMEKLQFFEYVAHQAEQARRERRAEQKRYMDYLVKRAEKEQRKKEKERHSRANDQDQQVREYVDFLMQKEMANKQPEMLNKIEDTYNRDTDDEMDEIEKALKKLQREAQDKKQKKKKKHKRQKEQYTDSEDEYEYMNSQAPAGINPIHMSLDREQEMLQDFVKTRTFRELEGKRVRGILDPSEQRLMSSYQDFLQDLNSYSSSRGGNAGLQYDPRMLQSSSGSSQAPSSQNPNNMTADDLASLLSKLGVNK